LAAGESSERDENEKRQSLSIQVELKKQDNQVVI
jgi:hypothetical protein